MSLLRARWPLLIVLLYLSIQTALLLSVDLPEYDEAIYLNVARNLRERGELVRGNGSLYADHTPLYQLLLGLATWLLGERLWLLRLLTVGFGLGALRLTYLLARQEGGETGATVAMLLVAASAFFNFYSFFLRPELPMLFFILLAALRYARGRAWQSGVAVAVAVLFKELALLFVAALLLHALLSGRRRELAALALPPAVALGGWLSFIYAVDPQRVQQTVERWRLSVAGPSGGLADSRSSIAVGAWVQTLGGDLFGWGLLLLLLIGAAALLRRRDLLRGSAGLMLLTIVVGVGLSLLLTLKEPRHLIAVIAAAAIVVGVALDWEQLLRRARWPTAALLLLVLWSSGPLQIADDWRNAETWWRPAYQRRMFEDDRYYGVLRPTGAYLRTIVPQGQTITVAHQGTVLGYYADRPYQFLYTLPLDVLLQTLAETQLLIYDSDAFPLLPPQDAQTARDYIDANFETLQLIDDGQRTVAVLRRRP